MKTGRLLLCVILCAGLLAAGCGRKGPPVPPDLPTAADDAADVDKKKVEIVDDSAKRIYDLYGEQPVLDETPAPVGTVDPLDEVPEEFRYLYEKTEETPPESNEDKKDEKSETTSE